VKNAFRNWRKNSTDYWINQVTNYVVKEASREEGEQWVIVDNNGMMLSSEWRDVKEHCFSEADRISKEETLPVNA
jgi:hypothetical protein